MHVLRFGATAAITNAFGGGDRAQDACLVAANVILFLINEM